MKYPRLVILWLYCLAYMALAAPTPLTNATPVTSNGEWSFPDFRAGTRMIFSVSGTFGGGTVTLGYVNASGTFTAFGTGSPYVLTAAGSANVYLPGSNVEGKGYPALSLTGATSPSLTILLTKTSTSPDIDDLTINAATQAELDEKSPIDVQSVQDLVNTQPWTASKIASWTLGGGGSAPPVRLLFFSDSLGAVGGGLQPGPQMGNAGCIGLLAYNRTGTVTDHTPPGSGRMDYWINGVATTLAIGATSEFTNGGSSVGDIRGDKCCIAYIKQSGGGTFNLQYQTNGTGSWTTLANIDTANATQIGAFAEYSLPTSNAPFFRLRVNNVATGPVVVVTTGIYNSNGGGVIAMPVAQVSGLDITASNTTPSAVFAPIWTGLAPDMVVSLFADTNTEWDSGGAFRTFYAAAKSAYNPTDFIQVSKNISYEDNAKGWVTSTNYALNALAYVSASGKVVLYRCTSAHTSGASTQPGIGASWVTVWALEAPQAGIETSSALLASTQAASQRAWALEAGETFINGAAVFGRTWAIANDRKLMSDIVHPSSSGATLRNMHMWTKLPVGNWYLGGGQKIGMNGASMNGAATSGSVAAQKVEFDRPLAVRSASGSFTLFDNSALFDNARAVPLQVNNRVMTIGNALTLSFAIDGTAGLYPGYNNFTFGSTSLRLSPFVTGINAGLTTKTAAYTATSNDHTILCDATSAAFAITLPSAATHSGRIYAIKKIDSSGNAITITGTVDGAVNPTLTSQWQVSQIQSNGTAWFKLN